MDELKAMSENLSKVIGLPVTVMDPDCNIILAVGWQDICRNFHRANPETARRCRISDEYVKKQLRVGEFFTYKCMNNMWDSAIPIIIEEEHLATVSIGQFFFDSEVVDLDFYRRQANVFGFDEEEYIAALQKVPVYSKEKIVDVMEYYKAFVSTLAESGLRKLLYMTASNRMQRMFNSMRDKVLILDSKGKIIDCNKPESDEWNLSPKEFLGKYYYEVLSKEQCAAVAQTVERLRNRETLDPFDLMTEYGGETKWYSTQVIRVENSKFNEPDYYVVALHDISERKKAENQIVYLSYRDKLTGVYNRRYYEEEIKNLDCEQNLPISIIIGDVNGLKLVNDAFGHAKGDEFLQKAAASIQKACRENDLIARWGGDEFVILLPETKSEEAEQIINLIETKYVDESVNAVNLSISFGYGTKTEAEQDIMQVLKNAEDNMYQHKLIENRSLRSNIIDTILNTLHEKNAREERHSKRVSEVCQKIGREMNLSEIDIRKLKVAGLLHDIGKIAIEEHILNKPGKLTELEYGEIKRHPDIGYRILASSYDMLDLAESVWAHHERWDGRGYPKGLREEEIPILARIISLADSYDAMSSGRPYKCAMDVEEIILEIKNNAGTQFDPEIAKTFVEGVLKKEWEALAADA
jgi:diguanylate cyclase (GGDEF)-like protein/PAS domain S-box-containing protein/putative nucleotidyltransferase with HDIG domain